MWLKKVASWTVKVIDSTSWGFAALGLFALIVMMSLTFMDVFLRYAFDRPIVGGTEITQYLMVCLITGAAFCALQGRHIKMDLFVQRLPTRAQAIIDSVTLTVSLAVYGITAWRIFLEAITEQKLNIQSSSLKIPAYPFYWVLGISLLLMALIMIIMVIRSIPKAVKK
jgi:TRAP-type C4-dicarboxylate transport system permease small subunit